MKRILVSGINGFVGKHLAKALKDAGYIVIGLGTQEKVDTSIESLIEKYYVCDLTDHDAVSRLPFKEMGGVINLAGLAVPAESFSKPDLYQRVNTAVLDTVCKSVLEQNPSIRIVAVSSGTIYSPKQPMPLKESSAIDPTSSPYAASKVAMEQIAMDYREKGLDCVIARPFNHTGPGQNRGFLLPDLYGQIANNTNNTLRVGNLTTRRDYTDVRDVAAAYVKLIDAPKLTAPVYNICSGKSVSGEEILRKILDKTGRQNVEIVVDESLFRPSDSPELFGDHALITADTGWEPTISLDRTIEDFIATEK